MTVRRLLAPLCLAAALIAVAAPAASASGGGGGGTGVPPVQLAPDSPTLTSGASEIVQVLITPAAPAGGVTLAISASNASLSVPSTLPIGAGLSNAQFQITANTVTAATPVTVTVKRGTSTGTVNFTVTPAATPSAAGVDIFPRVAASSDPVTLNVGLTALAPPGGVTVGLQSDSAALPVPATVFIPAGSGSTTIKSTAGAVGANTIVTVSETLDAKTVSGQVEIDPARVLSGLALNVPSVDGAKGTTGGVSISVPAVGNNYSVTLQSSNPAVASVPAAVGFLDGQSSTTFNVTTTQVSTPTDVVITATAGGVTKSQTLTVTPTPPPPFDIQTLALSPKVIAGSGTSTGTITTTVAAPTGGVTIKLSSSDTKLASVPASVVIPAGATSATFPIKVTGQSGATDVAIGAVYQNRGPAALLGVTEVKGGTLPADGTGNQRLDPRPVNDPNLDALGYYSGGTAQLESGQMPPGISLISNLRPGEFDFHGSPQHAGTYTFVLKFTGQVQTPYAIAYVWVITP